MAIEPASSLNISNLGQCVVYTPTKLAMRMEQLWKSQTAIFIFLRHFACIACRAHAKQVWNEREKYEKSGGKIIFIGNGQPDFIEKFKEDLSINQALVLTDPTLNAFRAAGFKKGFFYVVNPSSAVQAISLRMDGYTQAPWTKEAGTHWQMGGIVVVNTHGKATYHYVSEYLGDFPDEDNIDVIQADEKT